MLYDLKARDPSFADGHAPPDIEDILAWLQHALAERPPWRLISARRKLGRVLLEIEEETPRGPRRLIGKFGKSERAETLYQTLRSLRDAGFAPPARYTVPEPIAFVTQRGFVLQEKVPGEPAARLMNGVTETSAATDSANWLAALHRCDLKGPISNPDVHSLLEWADDLARLLHSERRLIRHITGAIVRELSVPGFDLMPSHGDFHPMNVFIANSQRVTGIDIDKFALREPEADIGSFLMQTAAFGFFDGSSFECTVAARRAFFEQYQRQLGRRIRSARVAMYIAMAFLKNLHFELVLLKTGRKQYADPWLTAAAVVMKGNLHFV